MLFDVAIWLVNSSIIAYFSDKLERSSLALGRAMHLPEIFQVSLVFLLPYNCSLTKNDT